MINNFASAAIFQHRSESDQIQRRPKLLFRTGNTKKGGKHQIKQTRDAKNLQKGGNLNKVGQLSINTPSINIERFFRENIISIRISLLEFFFMLKNVERLSRTNIWMCL